VTIENELHKTWYAMPNPLIGGWCVMSTPLPPGDTPLPEMADFCSEEVARHVAQLHNDWLASRSA